MNKKYLFVFLGLLVCTAFLNAQSLDQAIFNAAVNMGRDLPGNSTVAVIHFDSYSTELNNHVIRELHGAILRGRRLSPVTLNQSQLQSIQNEIRGGTLNAEATQRIGGQLGVQYLITGSLTLLKISENDPYSVQLK